MDPITVTLAALAVGLSILRLYCKASEVVS